MRSLIALAITAAGLALGGCYERPAPDLAMVPTTIERQTPDRCYAIDPYGVRGRIPC